MIFPNISLHSKLFPVQYQEHKYFLFQQFILFCGPLYSSIINIARVSKRSFKKNVSWMKQERGKPCMQQD